MYMKNCNNKIKKSHFLTVSNNSLVFESIEILNKNSPNIRARICIGRKRFITELALF